MIVRRRLSLQLTPLLDLLLIVIFAQYLDVRDREADSVSRAAQAETSRALAESELFVVRTQHEQATTALQNAARLVTELRQSNKLLQTDSELLRSDVDRALAQQRLLGELVSELFQVPESVLAEVLTPPGADQPAASPSQRAAYEQRLRELSLQQAGRMIRHLLSYDEMQKRCDLWELHIDEQGWLSLHAGSEQRGFRASTPDEFEEKFYAAYKSLPGSKSLVVIMLSYGDARADVREAAIQGLPRVTDRMRADSGGHIRFEYAVLGYQIPPEP
jgi:hypothetical protein